MSNAPFTVDWNIWQGEWHAWVDAAERNRWLRDPEGWKFPGVNVLADARLGTWTLPDGRLVELSEVTFPDLSSPGYGQHVRYIGVTLSVGVEHDSECERDGELVESFAALESLLGLA